MNQQFPKRDDHRTFSKADDVTKSSLLLEEKTAFRKQVKSKTNKHYLNLSSNDFPEILPKLQNDQLGILRSYRIFCRIYLYSI